MLTIKQIIGKIVYSFIDLSPVIKNKIVFDNFEGKAYGCNPKYIAEALLKRDDTLDLVWISGDTSIEVPEGIRVVKAGTLRERYEWASAKVWIDNVRSTRKAKKKSSQFYIQTWHASFGLKKIEAAAGNLPADYVERAKYDAKRTDLMIADNEVRKKQFETDFWYDGKVQLCGNPRNAILFDVPKEVLKKVYDYYHIDTNKHILLYVPTFRKSSSIDVYKFDYIRCLDNMKKKFHEDFVMLLRLHANCQKYSEEFQYNNQIINATDYPDVQELIASSHTIITDYSSCMFDAVFAKKNVFLLAKDIDDYMHNDQGFIYDYEKLPFSLAKSDDELEQNISNFDSKIYGNNCEAFFDQVGMVEDGKGDEYIANIIMSKVKE